VIAWRDKTPDQILEDFNVLIAQGHSPDAMGSILISRDNYMWLMKIARRRAWRRILRVSSMLRRVERKAAKRSGGIK
jgi:hypothetical protein